MGAYLGISHWEGRRLIVSTNRVMRKMC